MRAVAGLSVYTVRGIYINMIRTNFIERWRRIRETKRAAVPSRAKVAGGRSGLEAGARRPRHQLGVCTNQG